jgi:hypothetical protein
MYNHLTATIYDSVGEALHLMLFIILYILPAEPEERIFSQHCGHMNAVR